MNKVILIGRLTRDPELKFTAGSGIAVTTFTLAVDRNFKNKEGQKESDFISIVAWNKLAEIVANNLTKGRLIALSGRLQTRSYIDNNEQKRYVTEVIAEEMQFLDKKDDKKGEDFIPVDTDGNDIPF